MQDTAHPTMLRNTITGFIAWSLVVFWSVLAGRGILTIQHDLASTDDWLDGLGVAIGAIMMLMGLSNVAGWAMFLHRGTPGWWITACTTTAASVALVLWTIGDNAASVWYLPHLMLAAALVGIGWGIHQIPQQAT